MNEINIFVHFLPVRKLQNLFMAAHLWPAAVQRFFFLSRSMLCQGSGITKEHTTSPYVNVIRFISLAYGFRSTLRTLFVIFVVCMCQMQNIWNSLSLHIVHCFTFYQYIYRLWTQTRWMTEESRNAKFSVCACFFSLHPSVRIVSAEEKVSLIIINGFDFLLPKIVYVSKSDKKNVFFRGRKGFPRWMWQTSCLYCAYSFPRMRNHVSHRQTEDNFMPNWNYEYMHSLFRALMAVAGSCFVTNVSSMHDNCLSE